MSDNRPRHATEGSGPEERESAWPGIGTSRALGARHRAHRAHLAALSRRASLILVAARASPRSSASQRIKVDNSLSQLFRSDTPEFKQYEEVTQALPVERVRRARRRRGQDAAGARVRLEKLRDLVTDLQLIDGTRGIISLFSARQPPRGRRDSPTPLFPDELPRGRRVRRRSSSGC